LSVVGEQEFELQFAGVVGNRVAEYDAVLRIPECHRVEKSLGIVVRKLELPVLACVGGVVDAGLVARSRGHEKRFIGGKRDDGAEIEGDGVGDLARSPGAAAVGGSQITSVGAAGPGDLIGYGANSAEAFGCVGNLQPGLRLSPSHRSGKNEQERPAHVEIVAEILRKIAESSLACAARGKYNLAQASYSCVTVSPAVATIAGSPPS